MFTRLTLGKKIGLGFGLLVLLVAVLGAISWNGVDAISNNSELSNKGLLTIEHLNQ